MTRQPGDPAGTDRWTGPVADEAQVLPITESVPRFRGRVWEGRTDVVEIGGERVRRDIMVHPGAVGIVAVDADDRVLLVRQYRHPVAMQMFEPPAGLLDVAGEEPLRTAQRELIEEGGYVAATWQVLVDYLTSPGGSTEALRVYLARGVSPAPGGRQLTGEAEEQHMPMVWIPIEDAVDLIFAGRLQNPTAVAGIMAAKVARDRNWTGLRPADSPWPAREHLLATGRVFHA